MRVFRAGRKFAGIRTHLIVTGLFLALEAIPASAATVTFQLWSSDLGYTLGPAYTSPYLAKINGGVPILVVCDDFAHDVAFGDTWTANVTNMADLSAASAVRFDPVNTGLTDNRTWDYMTAAFLTEQLLNVVQTNPSDETTINNYSYAIWDVFDSSALNYLNAATKTIVTGIVNNAKNITDPSKADDSNNRLAEYSSVSIYTPVDANGNVASYGQEFLRVSTPEPAALGTFGFEFAGLIAATALLLRRRSAAPTRPFTTGVS